MTSLPTATDTPAKVNRLLDAARRVGCTVHPMDLDSPYETRGWVVEGPDPRTGTHQVWIYWHAGERGGRTSALLYRPFNRTRRRSRWISLRTACTWFPIIGRY